MEKSKWSNMTTVMLIVGLVVGFIVGAYWSSRGAKTNLNNKEQAAGLGVMLDDSTTGAPTSTDTTTMIAGVVMVEAVDQAAGDSVMLKSVTLPKLGWVAVRDSKDGKVGNILGAKRLPAGDNKDVTVILARSTMTKSSYVIFGYTDDGDMMFDYKKDLPLTKDSSPILATFNTL